jgi:Coenzyme PQQ synthesis protein D (PqqD)
VDDLRLRTQDLSWRDLDGEVVALDGEGSVYISTNRTGAALWRMLAGGSTREQLVGELVGSFDITRERAEADVDAFLGELRGKGLLA